MDSKINIANICELANEFLPLDQMQVFKREILKYLSNKAFSEFDSDFDTDFPELSLLNNIAKIANNLDISQDLHQKLNSKILRYFHAQSFH